MKTKLLFVLILSNIISICLSTSSCINKCQECTQFEIVCRGLNQTDLNLIKNPSENIKKLTFTNNNLNILTEPLFDTQTLNLEYLDLSSNNIRSIHKNVFQNLPQLTELILDNNHLDNIDFISPLAYLKRLSLNRALHPDFTQFSNRFFCSLPFLEEIYLQNNNLNSFDFNLDCIEQRNNSLILFSILNLESNDIISINSDLINKFLNLKTVNSKFKLYLSKNPFKCDCKLYEFFEFLTDDYKSPNPIIQDALNLVCIHQDSMQFTLNKRVLESNLNQICSQTTRIVTNRNPYIVFPSRKRNTTRMARFYQHHSNSKLVLFLLATLVLSASLLCIVHMNHKKLCKNTKDCFKCFCAYVKPKNYDGLLANPEDNDLFEYTSARQPNIFVRLFNTIRNFVFRNKAKNSNTQTGFSVQSSTIYNRFEDNHF